MSIPRSASILLIGGTGFIGTSLVTRLVNLGYHVTLPTRNREKIRQYLIIQPGVTVVDANVHDPKVLTKLMAGHDAVINLVGILHGSPAAFQRAHVTLTDTIMAAMRANGIRRYLHMGALGADIAAPSQYQQSKGAAEALVRSSGLDWTIFRPSLVFGPGKCFVSLFADLLKLAPLVPLGGANALMQPVWVEDVSRAFVTALARDALIGQSLNLVGPQVYSMQALIAYIGKLSGQPRLIVPLPDALARLQAAVMGLLPNPPLTADNLDSLKVDNVDPAGFPALLGWSPTAFETIAPSLLASDTPRERYLSLRRHHR